MIKVRSLVKRFGLKTVIRGLDFHVEAGEFVALMDQTEPETPPFYVSWQHFLVPPQARFKLLASACLPRLGACDAT
jgi:hypothetical protein